MNKKTGQYPWLLIVLGFTLAMHPPTAHAQVVGDIRGDIPFSFYAGNTKFPPGTYTIRALNDPDLGGVMEIYNAEGSISALFEVRNAEANSAPPKTELIFNKFGKRYFLARLFDEGEASGYAVIESHYERKFAQAAAERQERVPAQHLHASVSDAK